MYITLRYYQQWMPKRILRHYILLKEEMGGDSLGAMGWWAALVIYARIKGLEEHAVTTESKIISHVRISSRRVQKTFDIGGWTGLCLSSQS